jgi:DNA-binding MarR family transcriptional regulator
MNNEDSNDVTTSAAGTPTTWNPQASPSYWINRTSRVVLRLNDARLRVLGFGVSQMPVLQALQDGGARSQKELARVARIEQPTMAEMLGRMERDGIVERAPNPDDGRGSLISLTRRSKARWSKAKAALIEGEAVSLAGFSDDEKRLLISMLQRIVNNLEPAD